MNSNTRTIPLGNSGKYAIVDAQDYDWITKWKWQCNNSGYALRVTNIGGKVKNGGKQVSLLMHRVIMNPLDGFVVDHINANRLDNRRSNLRVCTSAQNWVHKSISKRNTSGYKGVSWEERSGKWLSLVIVNGKRKQLGLYDCKIEAAKVYNWGAEKYFGQFAKLNKIPEEFL